MPVKAFDFKALTGKDPASVSLVREFARHKSSVIIIEGDNRPRKTLGVSFKTLNLSFADSQMVALNIKQSGDIFQVLVNKKIVPIKNQDNLDKAVIEIIDRLDAGRRAFQKKQSLVRVSAPKPKNLSMTAANQTAILHEKRDNLKAEIEAVRVERAALEAEVGAADLVRDKSVPYSAKIGTQEDITTDQKPVRSFDQYVAESAGDVYLAAKAYMKNELQHGLKFVDTVIGRVFFTGKGNKELRRGMRSDGLKARLTQHIADILRSGSYDGREELNKVRNDDYIAFHYFEKDIELEDVLVTAGVNVGEREDKRLEYTAYGLGHSQSPHWKKKTAPSDTLDAVLRAGPFRGSGVSSEPTTKPESSAPALLTMDSIVGDGVESVNIVILRVIDKATGKRLTELEDAQNQNPVKKENGTAPGFVGENSGFTGNESKENSDEISSTRQALPEVVAANTEETIRVNGNAYVPHALSDDEAKAFFASSLKESGGNLFEAVKNVYKKTMQGHYIPTSIGKVLMTGYGWGKLKDALKDDEVRALTLIHIPEILRNGKVSAKEELKKERTDGILWFHPFTHSIELDDGRKVKATLKVGEREDHTLVYYLRADEDSALDALNENPQLVRVLPDITGDSVKGVFAFDSNVAQAKSGVNLVILEVYDKGGNRLPEHEDAQEQEAKPVAEITANDHDDDALLAELMADTSPVVDEKAAVGDTQEQATPIEITGNELGVFEDTYEGKAALRQAAESAFEKKLGKSVFCKALNAGVELRKSKQTPAKFFYKNFNPKKLKSVAVLEAIIAQGSKFKPSSNPYDKSEKSVKFYHYLRTEFTLNGEKLAARVVIKEDMDGHFHYDHTIHSASMTLDSAINENAPKGALHPIKKPTGVHGSQAGRLDTHLIPMEDKMIVDASDSSVNDDIMIYDHAVDEEEKKLATGGSSGAMDAVDATAQSLPVLLQDEPSSWRDHEIILDRADAAVNGMVLNLFIEGEEDETTQEEPADDESTLNVQTASASDEETYNIAGLKVLPRAAFDAAIDRMVSEMRGDGRLAEFDAALVAVDAHRTHEVRAMLRATMDAQPQ